MTKNTLLLFAAILPLSSFCQQTNYVRNTLDTLCSMSFYGRGYVNQGDSLAAEFIKNEFERIGLQEVDGSYFQHYEHAVNTFPGDVKLSFDGNELEKGSQYLVDPASISGSGTLKAGSIEIRDILSSGWIDKIKRYKNKALLVDLTKLSTVDNTEKTKVLDALQYLKFGKDIPVDAVALLFQGKQPWYISDMVGERTLFMVFNDSVDTTLKEISYKVESKFIENYHSKNVIGLMPGTTDTSIVISAHYDHLGMMGTETYFPGANDNASGVALLLDLARHFKNHPSPYTIYFIAFSGEEAGLKGSRHFVENPLIPLEKIKLLLNLDLAGTGVDGITVVNGKVYPREFELIEKINQENQYIKQVKSRGEACNSDHCFFYQKGVKSLYFYTMGGTIFYHDIYDVSSSLTLNEYENYFSLIWDFLNGI